jgi:hypothetical protein
MLLNTGRELPVRTSIEYLEKKLSPVIFSHLITVTIFPNVLSFFTE